MVDHWRFVNAHAPRSIVAQLKCKLFFRILRQLFFRTHLRYVVFPIYLILTLPYKSIKNVWSIKDTYIREKGYNILCYPSLIPSCIRVFIYLLFCPGPIEEGDCEKFGVSLSQLKADNTVQS